MKEKELIVLPNILTNSAYVAGLRSPLEAVAEILDNADKTIYAKALREAATICETFAKVNLTKQSELFSISY